MIRVNLAEKTTKKKVAAAPGFKMSGSRNMPPIPEILILGAAIVGGYLWYSNLKLQSDTLDTQIGQAVAQKAQLDAVIAEDRIYESRKVALENRIRVIESLQRSQVSPIVSLDALSLAVDRTEYIWLSSLEQNNTLFTMAGTGTSVNAIADFVSNLEATGYFRNIDLRNAQDADGNFSFSMTCEFAPLVTEIAAARAPSTGGN